MFAHGFHQDPVPGVTDKLYGEAAEASLERGQKELARSRSLNRALQELAAEYRKEFRALVGGEAYARLAELRSRLHRKAADVAHSARPTLAGEQAVRQAKHQAVEESKRLLEELRVDEGRAKELRSQFTQRMAEAIATARGEDEGDAERQFVVHPEEVPKSVHNPWVLFQPPYPGWAWYYSWTRTDEPSDPSVGRFLDSASGSVGSFSTLQVNGADDSDMASSHYNTGMRFWYQVPVAGMVEAWLEMQSVTSSYSGVFIDEFGRSEANSHQQTEAYLDVILPIGGSKRTAVLADYEHAGRDASWIHSAYAPGERRWAHLFSRDTYAANTWVLLEVGAEDWNYFWCNDVTVGCYLTEEWFLRRAYVRSTGED